MLRTVPIHNSFIHGTIEPENSQLNITGLLHSDSVGYVPAKRIHDNFRVIEYAPVPIYYFEKNINQWN